MKKLLSVSLAVCLLSAMGGTLTSCFHKCEFSTDWSGDESAHWHACTVENCDKTADKADHTWDEGKITTPATQEAEGVRTYTCTVCAQEKTEAVVFTGMSENQWDSAFRSFNYKNFSYTEESTVKGSGVTVNTKSAYKFTKDCAWVKVTIAGQSEEDYVTSSSDVERLHLKLFQSIKALAPYASYAYDAETKTYKATKPVRIDELDASTTDITLTFSDGYLTKIEYSVSFKSEGIDFTSTSTVTLSDFGTVELDPDAR
jgi:hypothetical protein